MQTIRTAASALIFTLGFLTPGAPGQEPADPVIRSDVRNVVLDVIVRRKNMMPETKLNASDFTVTEDGVPQTIKSFRFVGSGDTHIVPGTAGSGSSPAGGGTLHEPNFVSIVFGEMGPDSRLNALKAADDFLDLEFQSETYAAVFRLNLRLNAVQSFTNDRALLKNAVRVAVSGSSMELAHATAEVLNQTTYTTTGSQAGISLNSGTDLGRSSDFATGGAASAPFSEAQRAIAAMASQQRDMVSQITGTQEMIALLRLAEYESKLPGRKTVLFLSEGLIKPPGYPEMMRKVIAAANRGNISFYCIDARGLTLQTSNGLTSGLIGAAANISSGQGSAPSSPFVAAQQMKQEDLINDALSLNTQLNMDELASGTGGFAVFGTNDFRKNMAHIMEDVRTHYEILYAPTSTVYDGRFREIKVHLRDPNLIVQSRSGYFAVPELTGAPLLPWEMEVLRALEAGPRTDFPFHAAAIRFRPLADGFHYEMGFDIETASLTAHVDPMTHAARLHATFLAIIKDAAGQIVGKVSQDIDREVPEDKFSQFRRGRIIITAPFDQPSGRYTVDAIASDMEGSRVSTKRFALIVPKPGRPALSALVLVHKVDPLEAPRDPGDPFEFTGGKVVPAIFQTGTTVFFVVYPAAGTEKPKLTVEFLQNGSAVSQSHPDPGAADELNSIPVISAAKLPAGDYVARVTVEQAGRLSQESILLTVLP